MIHRIMENRNALEIAITAVDIRHAYLYDYQTSIVIFARM